MRKFMSAMCRTHADVDAALGAGHLPVLLGDLHHEFYESSSAMLYDRSSAMLYDRSSAMLYGSSSARLYGSSSARLYGSSSARLYGSSSATLCDRSSAMLYDNSSARLYESSSARLYGNSSAMLYGNSSARLYDSSLARLYGSSSAVATDHVAIHRYSDTAKTSGGVVIDVTPPTTAAEWCDYYGVPVVDGVATLYKALDHNLQSGYAQIPPFAYPLGESVEAPDWDDGKDECGGGLHFSPHPGFALAFHEEATRFVACPVALADMRAPRAGDTWPHKIKARRTCGPTVEVDQYGTAIEEAE